jgi:hypothetical protein
LHKYFALAKYLCNSLISGHLPRNYEDEDDLGLGNYPDSKTTGHYGKRIGCAIFGRGTQSKCAKTFKNKK